MEKVLRSVLQKDETSNFNAISYAFGSQGIYTEMFSGLNLEQQLLIGGACDVSYQSEGNSYKIIEKYFLDQSNEIYYEIETEIGKNIPNFLTTEWQSREDNFMVNDNVENTDPYLFLVTEETTPSNSIVITLYKVYQNQRQKIKMKYIIFSQDAGGKKYISEVLVTAPSST